MLGVILIHRHMHSLTVTHESRNLKQARPFFDDTVSMLTCYAECACYSLITVLLLYHILPCLSMGYGEFRGENA